MRSITRVYYILILLYYFYVSIYHCREKKVLFFNESIECVFFEETVSNVIVIIYYTIYEYFKGKPGLKRDNGVQISTA